MPVVAVYVDLALRCLDSDVRQRGPHGERIGRTGAPHRTGKQMNREIGGLGVSRRWARIREAPPVGCDERHIGCGLNALEIDARTHMAGAGFGPYFDQFGFGQAATGNRKDARLIDPARLSSAAECSKERVGRDADQRVEHEVRPGVDDLLNDCIKVEFANWEIALGEYHPPAP